MLNVQADRWLTVPLSWLTVCIVAANRVTGLSHTVAGYSKFATDSFGPLVSIMMVCYRELKLNNQANKTHQNTAITRKAFYSDYMATL